MIAATLLPKLEDWNDSGPGPHELETATGNGWTLSISAERAESLGCRATELSVSRSSAANSMPLAEWAKRSAERITGLLEPLKVLEVDEPRDESILRSESPAAAGEQLRYYELRLAGHKSARLHRYQADRLGGKREAIPFDLTHEAIAKIVDDLTSDES